MKFFYNILLVLVLKKCLCILEDTSLRKPLIGVLTDKLDSKSYVPSSMAKWIWSSGGEVIPIQWNYPREKIDFLISKINGLIIQGKRNKIIQIGNLESLFNKYEFDSIEETTYYILYKILSINKSGKYFPLLAMNYGFDLILSFLSENPHILNKIQIDKSNYNLNFENENFENDNNTILFSGKIIKTIENITIILDNFDSFLDIKSFNDNIQLNQHLRPTSFVKIPKKELIISFEFKKYPIFGTKFFINEYLFGLSSRSRASINLSRLIGDNFINLCQKSNYGRSLPEGLKIENYSMEYNKNLKEFIFVFDKSDSEFNDFN